MDNNTKEDDPFFSAPNRLRAAALFFVGIVVAAFVVRIDSSAHVVPGPAVATLLAATTKSTVVDTTGASSTKFLDGFRSNSRLTPMRNNEALKGFGFLNTFKAKYQLLETRSVSKGYSPPSVKADGSAKSDVAGTYLYTSIYQGDDCSGPVYAVSGASVATCNAVPNNGDDDTAPYASYMIDCAEGDIVMLMYASSDCSGDYGLIQAVGTYGACVSTRSKSWLEDARAPFSDAETISMSKQCSKEAPIDISRTVVFKYTMGDSLDACLDSPSDALDVPAFEAYPVGACVPTSAIDSSSSSSSSSSSRRLGGNKAVKAADSSPLSFQFGYKPSEVRRHPPIPLNVARSDCIFSSPSLWQDNVVFANVFEGSDGCESEATTSTAPTGCYGDASTGFFTSVTYFF